MNFTVIFVSFFFFVSQFVNALTIAPISPVIGGGETTLGLAPTPLAIKPIANMIGGESEISIQSLNGPSQTAPVTSPVPTTSAISTANTDYQFESKSTRFNINNDLFIVTSFVSALFLV
jgi:hypothetical protein